MWHIITPEMQKAQEEANRRQLDAMMEKAKRDAEIRANWEKAHPPCPHCGRRDEMPIWIQYPA